MECNTTLVTLNGNLETLKADLVALILREVIRTAIEEWPTRLKKSVFKQKLAFSSSYKDFYILIFLTNERYKKRTLCFNSSPK